MSCVCDFQTLIRRAYINHGIIIIIVIAFEWYRKSSRYDMCHFGRKTETAYVAKGHKKLVEHVWITRRRKKKKMWIIIIIFFFFVGYPFFFSTAVLYIVYYVYYYLFFFTLNDLRVRGLVCTTFLLAAVEALKHVMIYTTLFAMCSRVLPVGALEFQEFQYFYRYYRAFYRFSFHQLEELLLLLLFTQI